MLDARRRGNGVAQVFPTKESLEEYTKRTASHFPYDSPKAGKLLRRLLRKPHENTLRNQNKASLVPPPDLQDGSYEAKKQDPQKRQKRLALEAKHCEIQDGSIRRIGHNDHKKSRKGRKTRGAIQ